MLWEDWALGYAMVWRRDCEGRWLMGLDVCDHMNGCPVRMMSYMECVELLDGE